MKRFRQALLIMFISLEHNWEPVKKIAGRFTENKKKK